MPLRDRFVDCNNATTETYTPFIVGGITIGWFDPAFLPRLRAVDGPFLISDRAVLLRPVLGDYSSRTSAVDAALRNVYDVDDSGFGRWTGERTPTFVDGGSDFLLEIERAALAVTGVYSRGVQLNGYTVIGGEVRIWLGRRSRHIASHPGELDQLVGGFLPYGQDPWPKLVEEAAEEASLGEDILKQSRCAGYLRFCRRASHGLQRGNLVVYDLELPPGLEPRNVDGEVEGFELHTVDEILRLLQDAAAFKFDSAMVTLDFMIRHGLIDPRHPEAIGLARRFVV